MREALRAHIRCGRDPLGLVLAFHAWVRERARAQARIQARERLHFCNHGRNQEPHVLRQALRPHLQQLQQLLCPRLERHLY